MTTILYARVSTSDQDFEPQLIELRREAQRRGLKTWEEVTDVISGGKQERDGLGRVMAGIRRGEIGTLMAVRLDRLARSLSHFGQLSDELVKRNVGLVLTAQGVDTTGANPCGRMLQGILAVIAEFERDLIRERTRAGMAAARARGATIGRPSPKLVGVDRETVCGQWLSEGRPGGYAGLGKRLGGVGKMTAWRIFKQWRPAVVAEIA